jgi:hypothetical protein
MTLNSVRFATLLSFTSPQTPPFIPSELILSVFCMIYLERPKMGVKPESPGSPLPPESVRPHLQTIQQPNPGRCDFSRHGIIGSPSTRFTTRSSRFSHEEITL